MSNTERRVWFRLRRNKLGLKFRRQHPIGPYFADFACIAARLVVEVDGILHDDPAADDRKTTHLESRGWTVLRVPVSEVDEHLDDVIEGIWMRLHEPIAPP